MAGIYAIIGRDNSRIKTATKHLQFFETEYIEVASEPDFAFGWVSQDKPELFSPALDPQTGVRVISAGRVAWDESEWQQAARLNQYKGGLSNRLLLKQYLKGGVSAIERHNGSAILLIWDPRQQQVHLLSDHFGYYPVFLYQPERIPGCVISSFPDAIADDPDVELSIDYVSMAEFLRQGKATPPHTFYQEVKYPGAATHCWWDLKQGTYQHREYWQPFQADYFPSLPEAAEELAAAVRQSIYIRTLPRLGPIASFTSGGLDSRAILFAAADPSCVYGINLYDTFNQEAANAQQLCQAAGVKYIGVARDPDYYLQWMPLGAKYSGAMLSQHDNHFLGTRELVCEKLQAQTVLSGCSTDFLFKDANLDRACSSVPLLNKPLPWLRLESKWNGGFLDPELSLNSPVAGFEAAMSQRLQEWFAGASVDLVTDCDHLLVEDKRNRPMCYSAGLSFQLMFRTLPYDAFLADRAIADCYSRIPAQWKLNSRLWGLVIAKICGRSIVDANYGWRPGASLGEKVLHVYGNNLKRKLGLIPTVKHQGLATNGSWPNFRWYISHSSALKQMWESTSKADRQFISELWGSDPWQLSLEEWANFECAFFRITTLLTYWNIREKKRVAELGIVSLQSP